MKFLLLTVLSLTISGFFISPPEPVILLADLGVPMDVGSLLVSATDGC